MRLPFVRITSVECDCNRRVEALEREIEALSAGLYKASVEEIAKPLWHVVDQLKRLIDEIKQTR